MKYAFWGSPYWCDYVRQLSLRNSINVDIMDAQMATNVDICELVACCEVIVAVDDGYYNMQFFKELKKIAKKDSKIFRLISPNDSRKDLSKKVINIYSHRTTILSLSIGKFAELESINHYLMSGFYSIGARVHLETALYEKKLLDSFACLHDDYQYDADVLIVGTIVENVNQLLNDYKPIRQIGDLKPDIAVVTFSPLTLGVDLLKLDGILKYHFGIKEVLFVESNYGYSDMSSYPVKRDNKPQGCFSSSPIFVSQNDLFHEILGNIYRSEKIHII